MTLKWIGNNWKMIFNDHSGIIWHHFDTIMTCCLGSVWVYSLITRNATSGIFLSVIDHYMCTCNIIAWHTAGLSLETLQEEFGHEPWVLYAG